MDLSKTVGDPSLLKSTAQRLGNESGKVLSADDIQGISSANTGVNGIVMTNPLELLTFALRLALAVTG